MDLAIGPICVCSVRVYGTCPVIGTLPWVGLSPKIPQYEAGTLIEPPESLPIPIGDSKPAIAAASPPLDPPGVRVISHGLLVLPNTRLSVSHQSVNSGVFVLPINIPPAFFNLSATGAFSVRFYTQTHLYYLL